jgi:hypothetical protein
MISILTHEPISAPHDAPPHEVPASDVSSEDVTIEVQAEPLRVEETPDLESTTEPTEEFEFVLGRRQIASLLFVATVVIVVFSAFSYLAGEIVSKKANPAAVTPTPVAAPQPVAVADPLLQADIVEAPAKPEAPLFADPKIDAVYLQMGAVEKGIGMIFAEGLRKHGFDAFVAPGPNDHIFRVLIGPIPDPRSFERTKEAVDKLGIGTFGKKYVQETASPASSKP